MEGAQIWVGGIVQGVGFRPFVYNLALRHGLSGWVRNTSAGVEIELDGRRADLEEFVQALQAEAPTLARIDEVRLEWRPANGFQGFEIRHSEAQAVEFQPVSPDVSICADCLRELFDPQDRRYRYPFINCTNCGPRFTITQDIPYDRRNTTMAGFALCAECAAEYEDPTDRRFHAEPIACPQCGPQVWLEAGGQSRELAQGDAAILKARDLLFEGKILAIKGLGGFHLACDATNIEAVRELRRRKLRVDKPFALMLADIEGVQAHCLLSPVERRLVEQRERPIVIVRRRFDSPVAAEVAPGQNTLGVMLPYTPLHYLLFAQPGATPPVFDLPPLVMTSGNLSEEPICATNEAARSRLAPLADAFLMHNRPIHIRCDDSVVRMFPATRREQEQKRASGLYPLRRARGFAPDPVRLAFEVPPVLGVGAELKNTFCLTRQRYAFLSHHIGDMENLETLESFEQGVEHFERLFRIQPQAIAYDLHPDYMATRYALRRAEAQGLSAVGVQHHHAHIAACMAENGLSEGTQVIGVAFDGTGYGEDGAIWGGEVLLADYGAYRRALHLQYAPLPGGDQAARAPWRMALAWLERAGLDWAEDLPPVRYALEQKEAAIAPLEALRGQLRSRINCPDTSSMGRLFDAVAALIGVRQTVNYEAQAAIELEAGLDGREPRFYPFELRDGVIDPAPMLRQALEDLRAGAGIATIAARFHNGVAKLTLEACSQLRAESGINKVALSGGVWQNSYLLTVSAGLLQEAGFEIYLHRQTPANDGGLSLGQAVAAAVKLNGIGKKTE
ncbi:MAG: carbamoyltransferase HypF [Anaerolineae bacterium UTCFX2]|nr:carbamoyltransferase HypF [Anaerolineae bacterium]MCZ7551752.1 carbamoyltransferase HypF [Anaerolineales bacterium]OQY90139.1 MAG: carbamoyltransferase HypF [Anaerolineae bacterium UTCFX2]